MRLNEKTKLADELTSWLRKKSVEPEEMNRFLKRKGTSEINQKIKAINLAGRPQIALKELLTNIKGSEHLGFNYSKRKREIIEAAEIKIKYSGYMERERGVADKIMRLEDLKIHDDISYEELTSISTEGRQKLSKIRPTTIGQASRISGVSTSDISILIMYLGR